MTMSRNRSVMNQAGFSGAHTNDTHAAPTKHLNQIELSRRWTVSPRTLERWRWRNEGPVYLKIGGRVAYRLDDIEAFEAKQVRMPGQARNG